MTNKKKKVTWMYKKGSVFPYVATAENDLIVAVTNSQVGWVSGHYTVMK